MNVSDGKWNIEAVKERIKIFTFDYIEKEIIPTGLDGNIQKTLLREIECNEAKIKQYKNENYFGYGVQLYEHQKNTLLEYCKLKNIPTTTQSTPKEIKPIQLNLEQRQIIYLFQTLIKEQMLNETNNPNLWHLVSQYFTDKEGNQLKNIHQNKDGLQNSKTGKPKKLAKEIQNLVTNTKKSLE